MKRLAASIETRIATLTAYRKSLIHECVTGQRRISEADLVRSELSGNTGQLNLGTSGKIGRSRTSGRDDQQYPAGQANTNRSRQP